MDMPPPSIWKNAMGKAYLMLKSWQLISNFTNTSLGVKWWNFSISVCSEKCRSQTKNASSSLWKPNFLFQKYLHLDTCAFNQIENHHCKTWPTWIHKFLLESVEKLQPAPNPRRTSPNISQAFSIASAFALHERMTKSASFPSSKLPMRSFCVWWRKSHQPGEEVERFSAHIFWSQEFRIFRTPPPQCTDGIKKLFFKMTESLHRSTETEKNQNFRMLHHSSSAGSSARAAKAASMVYMDKASAKVIRSDEKSVCSMA